MVNKIKENWDTIDKICPSCGQVTKKAIGFNKQNLKKLCRSKPSLQDIIIFIMLIGILALALSYNYEIAQYKKMFSNPEGFCLNYYNEIIFKDVNQLENNKVYSDFNKTLQNDE